MTQTELYGLEEDLGLDDESDKSVDAGNVGKLLEVRIKNVELVEACLTMHYSNYI